MESIKIKKMNRNFILTTRKLNLYIIIIVYITYFNTFLNHNQYTFLANFQIIITNTIYNNLKKVQGYPWTNTEEIYHGIFCLDKQLNYNTFSFLAVISLLIVINLFIKSIISCERCSASLKCETAPSLSPTLIRSITVSPFLWSE